MGYLVALVGLFLIVGILLDSFESVILPRRVVRPFRFARFYFLTLWKIWRIGAEAISAKKTRETALSFFGPMSLLGLFMMWALGFIIGFGLVEWGLQIPIGGAAHHENAGILSYFYLSATTYFTLGMGDVVPLSAWGQFFAALEAGLGFGFLATIISYLPMLYQSFSKREVTIALLDARAGSPPSASELLLRLAKAKNPEVLTAFLAEWERWAAEVLESQLSYPVLCFYRSQHDNQSWLAALTTVLDTCALVIAGVKDADTYQAQLTFAMARHAVVDLALVFKLPPREPNPPRLTSVELEKLRGTLSNAAVCLREGAAVETKLTQLREMYEPFVMALADHLHLQLPLIVRDQLVVDNWQTSAWTRRLPGFDKLASQEGDEHFV